MDEEDEAGYDDVQIENDDNILDKAHSFLDKYAIKPSNTDYDDNDGGDAGGGYDDIDFSDDEIPISSGGEDVTSPESYEVATHKYNIEPDIAPEQQHDFGPNRSFFGRHVVNSNTKRSDNFRHLMQFDLCDDYNLIPSRRQRCNQIRQRVTAEYQACRSNPEIGGFDRKLQRAVIKREDVDVKQTQTLNNLDKKKRRSILGMIGGKKR